MRHYHLRGAKGDVLAAFTASLLLVTVSELGDKTFFIAMILAMRHARRPVFVGVVGALAAMTVLSVLVGQTASFLPQIYVQYAEIILFAAFGLKLLWDSRTMKDLCSNEEQQEASEAVAQAEARLSKHQTLLTVIAEAFTLTFIAEWGDRTQFTTIALAAANNPFGVTLGATLGHAICAAIAVIGGRFICTRISEQMLTRLGGGLFLIFAAVALLDLIKT